MSAVKQVRKRTNEYVGESRGVTSMALFLCLKGMVFFYS